MPMHHHPCHLEIHVPTHEDWHPSFEGPDGLLSLRVRVYSAETAEHARVLVCVWGADDTGMERWIHCTPSERESVVEAQKAFALEMQQPLTRLWLAAQGFNPA